MAKCPVCSTKKGKRICQMTTTIICSLCCGTVRKEETCKGCPHYKEPDKSMRYREVPRYSTMEMAERLDLQNIARIIETEIHKFDQSSQTQIKDETALNLFEFLIDYFYFKEDFSQNEKLPIQKGTSQVLNVLRINCSNTSEEDITKVIGSLYFVAKKRSKGNREYLDFIQQFVAPGTKDGGFLSIF